MRLSRPGETDVEQEPFRVLAGGELITFLALRFLTTGKRLDDGWLRTNDVLENGNRVIFGFGPLGFVLGTCPDDYVSPATEVDTVFVLPARRK